MKRFALLLLIVFGMLVVPSSAQKPLHLRKAYCVAAIPSDWAGGVNRASHDQQGQVSISSFRGFDTAAFPILKKDYLESYQPGKVLDDSGTRLWFEYTSAATPTNFDRHWYVIVVGKEETCTLNIHFASSAEAAVRPIAESLKAMR